MPNLEPRVTLIVLTSQPGWEEMENLRGDFRKFEEMLEEIIWNKVSLEGSPTINAMLMLKELNA